MVPMKGYEEKESPARRGGAGVSPVPAMTAPCVWIKAAVTAVNRGWQPKARLTDRTQGTGRPEDLPARAAVKQSSERTPSLRCADAQKSRPSGSRAPCVSGCQTRPRQRRGLINVAPEGMRSQPTPGGMIRARQKVRRACVPMLQRLRTTRALSGCNSEAVSGQASRHAVARNKRAPNGHQREFRGPERQKG